MAKNIAELTSEIEAILTAKQALVTAGLLTEAEYAETKKTQLARIDAAAATTEVVTVVEPAAVRVRKAPPAVMKAQAPGAKIGLWMSALENGTITDCGDRCDLGGAALIDYARERLIYYTDNDQCSERGEAQQIFAEYVPGRASVLDVFGYKGWISMVCTTALHNLEDLVEPIEKLDPKQYREDMRRWNAMLARRRLWCALLRKKFDAAVASGDTLLAYGFRSELEDERDDLGNKIAVIDARLSGSADQSLEARRKEYIADHERLTAQIAALNSAWRRLNRFWREGSLFLDIIEMKGDRLDKVGKDRFKRGITLIRQNRIESRGKTYESASLNTYIKRVRTLVYNSLASIEYGVLMPYNALAGVKLFEEKPGTGMKPPDPFYLRVGAGETEALGTYRLRFSDVSQLYKYLHKARYPKIKKNRELLEICIRLMRETGLRSIHNMYFKWGDMPRGPEDIAEEFTTANRSNLYTISYDSVLAGIGKELAKKHYISEKLARLMFAYRRAHPEIKDDWRVFDQKRLLGSGDHITPMIKGTNHLFDTCISWVTRDSLRRAEDTVFGNKPSGIARMTPSDVKNTIKAINDKRGWKLRPTSDKDARNMIVNATSWNLRGERMRDSFMTLMLSMLTADAATFKNTTGDDYNTATDHYEDLTKISAPETKVRYSDIIRIVFDKE